MRLVFDPDLQRKEQRGIELWQWIMGRTQERWPAANVRYHSYSGINHRHWRILRSTGQYHVLAVTEEVLDELTQEEIIAYLEEADWLEMLDRASSSGLLLLPNGTLIEWDPRAGGVMV